MSSITKETVKQAKVFVLNLLEKELPKVCVFHNGEHTIDVYTNSQIIGKEIGLSHEDLNCLALAAIFHDVGYINSYDDHELVSAEMAGQYLISIDVDEEKIKLVKRAILATKVPQKPLDLISKALCDADLMHLADDNYFESIEPMRLEWKLTGRSNLSEMEFHSQSIVFFAKHEYHTAYGKEVLSSKKAQTLDRIKAILSD